MSYQIFIKGNKTLTVEVTEETLVDNLYQYIKIPKDYFYLIYSGKVLKEGEKLTEYSIKPESTIEICLRATANPINI